MNTSVEKYFWLTNICVYCFYAFVNVWIKIWLMDILLGAHTNITKLHCNCKTLFKLFKISKDILMQLLLPVWLWRSSRKIIVISFILLKSLLLYRTNCQSRQLMMRAKLDKKCYFHCLRCYAIATELAVGNTDKIIFFRGK